MKRVRSWLTIALLLTVFGGKAQLNKTDADNLVLNTIVNDTTKVVYSMSEAVGRGESVMTADGTEITNPYNNAYVYFIDDIPAANWVHQCRYCFINMDIGTYTVEYDNIYPYDFQSFERISEPTIRSRGTWPYSTYTIPSQATPNGKLYAVLIAGDAGADGSIRKAWFNLSCVYTALINKYGFMEKTANNSSSHIFVCPSYEVSQAMNYIYPNGSFYTPEIDLNHSCGFGDSYDINHTYSNKLDVQQVFQNLDGSDNSLTDIPVLSEEDQLFIFICGEGSTAIDYTNTKIMLKRGSNPEYLYDYELASWVRNIKCSQMTFLIDCNFAGGFIDNLMNDNLALCKNRAVHTSTDATHVSWSEQHISCHDYRSGNDESLVDEYVYYWSAASLGYYPILGVYSDSISGPWYHYSQTTIGQFPWNLVFQEVNGCSHADYDVNPDTNADGILSMEEAFIFADNLDSYSPTGYFNPYTENNTDVEYPSHSYESTFTKELITLDGYKGTISNDAATGAGHKYLMDGSIVVDEYAILTISNNSLLEGNNNNCNIYGVMTTASNINNATFKRLSIKNKGGDLSLSHCSFDTCGTINSTDGPFSITNSAFSKSKIYANNSNQPRDSYSIVISDNVINNTLSNDAIYLYNIPQCVVSDNEITSVGNGIKIQGLNGTYQNYVFQDNTISNCGGSGFVSYSSNAGLSGNVISSNGADGIQSLNNSSLYILGDNNAYLHNGTQEVYSNDRYQVYATNNSYPQNFHYNCLGGNGTTNDIILYYESNHPNDNRPLVFNLTNNFWYAISDNNIPSHLQSTGNTTFSYLPTWTPYGVISMPDEAGVRLILGNELVENGNYDEARQVFRGIVTDFPENVEAITALKALFSIEVDTEGSFSDLKNYYLDMVEDDYLGYIADNLANRCDVEMKNYTDAIGWYENKIIDPNTSCSERIFAEIDLGDLYLQMNSNGNKGIQGKMTEYIPVSKELHAKRTEYLLSLIPMNSDDNTLPNSDETVSSCQTTHLSCSPNPSSDIATLSYTLHDDSYVTISVTDVLGNEIKQTNLGRQNSGSHKLDIELSDLSEGMYFCNIQTDGKNTETIKIIVKH